MVVDKRAGWLRIWATAVIVACPLHQPMHQWFTEFGTPRVRIHMNRMVRPQMDPRHVLAMGDSHEGGNKRSFVCAIAVNCLTFGLMSTHAAESICEQRIRWLPLGLGVLAAIWFALLCPPSFYWLDCGELAAAGVGLGSPHPTGFPLYMMLVRLASLVPLGEIAFRVNLLSAACAGVCVGLVAQLVIRLSKINSHSDSACGLHAASGAAIAALALSSSLLFTRHAVVAEVYVPSATLLVAMFLAVERTVRTGDPRWGLVLAVVCGLGLGLHSSFRLIAFFPVAALVIISLRRGARWPLYAPLLALLIGATLHAYLPVRSAAEGTTLIDWGHPRDLGATLNHVTAARIRAAYSDQIASTNTEVVRAHLKQFVDAVFDGSGPILPILAVIGVAWLFGRRRYRLFASTLTAAFVIDFGYSFWINPMGLIDGQNGTNVAVALAIAAGVGAAALLARTRWAAPFVGAVMAVVCVTGPMLSSWAELASAASHEIPRRRVDKVMTDLPPRAIVLTQSDSLSAGLLFVRVAEGARPDVAAIVRQHLADKERVVALLRSSSPKQMSLGAGVDGDRSSFLTIVQTGRPIGWELGIDRLPPGMKLVVGAVIGELARQRQLPDHHDGTPDDITKAIDQFKILFADGGDDPISVRELAVGLTNIGRLVFSRGDIKRAQNLFEAALRVRPEHVAALVNLATMYSYKNELAQALILTERALALDPNRLVALINAARYANALGKRDHAYLYIRRALALSPGHPGATRVAADIDLSDSDTHPLQ